jgi:hypothetical protein
VLLRRTGHIIDYAVKDLYPDVFRESLILFQGDNFLLWL